jgi:uncharacterized BrkB/YihY/UPF0761 family membrane protein
MATITVAQREQTPETPTRVISRATLAMLIVGTVVLSLAIFSQTSLNLSFISPDSPSGTLVLIGMSALIFLLFITLTFMLLRNIVKLFAERHGSWRIDLVFPASDLHVLVRIRADEPLHR